MGRSLPEYCAKIVDSEETNSGPIHLTKGSTLVLEWAARHARDEMTAALDAQNPLMLPRPSDLWSIRVYKGYRNSWNAGLSFIDSYLRDENRISQS